MDQTEPDHEAIVEGVLGSLGPSVSGRKVVSATWRRHSNDVGRVELDDGRVMMIKVGRFEWTAPRFRAERLAAQRLHSRDIVVPQHLDVPEEIAGWPVLAYWRIELPTLATIWRERKDPDYGAALRDWGTLLRRVHALPSETCGPLSSDEPCRDGIGEFMEQDLGERLRPAVSVRWPGGLEPLDTVLEMLPELRRRLDDAPKVLLHGDPHAGNVMVRPEETGVSCDGLIDLETAAGGPRELDLAHAMVLHGPLFTQELPEGWFDHLVEGYDMALDPFALRWFAIYHLLNLGFFSALVGDHEHAALVAEDAARRAADLRASG